MPRYTMSRQSGDAVLGQEEGYGACVEVQYDKTSEAMTDIN